MRSIRSGSIGRLRRATEIDCESLSRSNGTLRPERLTTVSSRKLHTLERRETATAIGAYTPATDGRVLLRRPAVLHLVSSLRAIRAAHGVTPRAGTTPASLRRRALVWTPNQEKAKPMNSSTTRCLATRRYLGYGTAAGSPAP